MFCSEFSSSATWVSSFSQGVFVVSVVTVVLSWCWLKRLRLVHPGGPVVVAVWCRAKVASFTSTANMLVSFTRVRRWVVGFGLSGVVLSCCRDVDWSWSCCRGVDPNFHVSFTLLPFDERTVALHSPSRSLAHLHNSYTTVTDTSHPHPLRKHNSNAWHDHNFVREPVPKMAGLWMLTCIPGVVDQFHSILTLLHL